jgi:hypothetical protein
LSDEFDAIDLDKDRKINKEDLKKLFDKINEDLGYDEIE